MSPSRASPAVRSPSPNSTPWPTFSTPTTSSVAVDANISTNTRPADSPSRSPKKMKGRARQERVAEEDIRFNIGPKSPRAILVRRLMRRTRPERVIDPYTMDIPDYPPPSFQEAISSPAVSISQTIAVSPTPPQPDPDAHEHENENEDSSPRYTQIIEQPTSAVSDSDSGSDSSHDFYHVDSTSSDIRRDSSHIGAKDNQHGLTFPSTLRGRTKSRDDPDVDEHAAAVHVVSAARRHNSLSPVRTLFPSLHFTLHDRAASAHPTTEPTSSPYPLSRGMSSFFRSTTSLGLLHGTGNVTPTTLKSKTSMTSNAAMPKRKLFSPSKGKERIVVIDPEMDYFDSWEVIDAAEADETDKPDAAADVSVELPAADPFKEPIEEPAPPAVSRVQRAQRSPPRPSSPTPSRTIHSHEVPLSTKLSNGSPITTVRSTRRQTTGPPHILTTKKSQVINSSPLGIQTWRPDEESPITIGGDADASLMTALETPLPPTPVEAVSQAPTNPKLRSGYSSEFRSFIADTAGLQFTLSTDSFTTAADCGLINGGPETPTKKHYRGRPLPPAPRQAGPGVRPPVDPSLENEASKDKKGEKTNCPEGLLIDLDDNTFVSGMSTPEAARSQVDLLLPPSPAPSSMPGFPMIGYGHGQHLASASVSTPNLASQPIFPTPLHVVSMTPSQSQSGPQVWTPLCAITAESRWTCDCRAEPEYSEYWARQPVHLASKDAKNVSPSPHLTHVHPFALALARAQTHPAALSGTGVGVFPLGVQANKS